MLTESYFPCFRGLGNEPIDGSALPIIDSKVGWQRFIGEPAFEDLSSELGKCVKDDAAGKKRHCQFVGTYLTSYLLDLLHLSEQLHYISEPVAVY